MVSTPLKNMSSSVGIIIPNIWKNMFQTTNQIHVSSYQHMYSRGCCWDLAEKYHPWPGGFSRIGSFQVGDDLSFEEILDSEKENTQCLIMSRILSSPDFEKKSSGYTGPVEPGESDVRWRAAHPTSHASFFYAPFNRSVYGRMVNIHA